MRIVLIVGMSLVLASCAAPRELRQPDAERVILTVVGTNDVHGVLVPEQFNGGLSTLSAYVSAVRDVRAADGGAVLLIDAGDMWQGTLESNLVEGASVVQAFNALGYTAAAIGNHEFDFGPAGALAVPEGPGDDPQGALKKRASEANFPLLAANLLDASSGEVVDWDNVRASLMVDVAGIKVGIVGVVTKDAPYTTIAANTAGLTFAPLADTIEREAVKLRAGGADLLIVTAHAGARCEEFDDPHDLSSCDLDGEIVRVANALPRGLVDHIIAGHVHQGVAHVVNGIAITASYSNTYAFSRVDYAIDKRHGEIIDRRIYPPQVLCPRINLATGNCEWTNTDPATTRPASYEGRAVKALPSITAIAERAKTHAAEKKSEQLGVSLVTPFTLEGNPESPLANLFTDAQLAMLDADVAIHNVTGGIRATLPAGELTYGRVFELFPFDNRTVILDLSGAELRRIVAEQALKVRRRAGFSGMRVFIGCNENEMSVVMVLDNGRVILDEDRVRLAANDFLVTGGDHILTPAMPAGGFKYNHDPRLTRDVLADWFRQRGGSLAAEEFDSETSRRWNLPESLSPACSL